MKIEHWDMKRGLPILAYCAVMMVLGILMLFTHVWFGGIWDIGVSIAAAVMFIFTARKES